MTPDERLLYETRVRNRQAAVAVAAGVLLIAASVISLGGPHTSVDELTLDLLVANHRFPLDLIASVVNGLASLGIAWTLLFLLESARARVPGARAYTRIVVLAAGILTAVAGVVYAVVVAIKVHDFATTGLQTYQEADRLTGGAGLLLLQLVGQFAALLMAVSFVLVSLQAMNTGLLTRFMGYLGMFAGALVLFQITQVPVVQCFWLLAAAYLISGRWPTGIPPAWRSGAAEPWPSSSAMRAQRVARGGARGGGAAGSARGRAKPVAGPTPAAQAAGAGADDGAGRTRATTPKRKRKHRR
ncbi:MAG: hypothetical protein ABSH51_07890 [Solirubrobacteraceae bacterium]|jgi:hypothetical protein